MNRVGFTKIISGMILGLGIFLSSAAASAGEAPITQGEWAVYLARGLGLEKALPEGTSADRYISILGQQGYQRVEGEDYREASPAMSTEIAPDSVMASRKKWLGSGKESGTVKYRVDVPINRQYKIRARIRGGAQFWSVDEGGSVMLTPDSEFSWFDVGEYNLKPGEHNITVAVSPGSALDVFELITGTAPPVVPAGGFDPLKPLTYGAKAETLIKALNLEDELPIDEGFYLIMEAELFDQAAGNYDVTKGQKPGVSSEDRWLKSEGEVTASYHFDVPEKGLYSIQARGFGTSDEDWTLDLGLEKVTRKPISPKKFGWFPVTTTLLEKGPHTIEVVLRKGNGTDVIMVLRRRAEAGNYLQLLSDLGLQEGALPPTPAADQKDRRRYEPYKSVEGEDYVSAKGAVDRSDDGRYGEPSDQEWVKPAKDLTTFRYTVRVDEDGMYAVYMRSFGSSKMTWVIDPKKDDFREKRDVFPRSQDSFLWQEVVSLELTKGEHVLEVTMPGSDGLDVFELRKRPWLTPDLDALAKQPVTRAEALRNLKEVEERYGGSEEEEEPEPEPEPSEGGPRPTPGFEPLSPYVPGS